MKQVLDDIDGTLAEHLKERGRIASCVPLPAAGPKTTLAGMKVNEKIKEQLQRIVDLGKDIVSFRQAKTDSDLFAINQKVGQWGASVRSILTHTFGEGNEYCRSFVAELKEEYHPYHRAHGVVLAAQADYLSGGIFKVRHLVEAEIFDDFLEQAEHLLANGGYFQASAVIAGCVLEDALRKLCTRHGVTLPAEPKLDWMNSELAKKGVYDKLVQKRVTAEADLRNKAAHGRWTEFKREDVESMIPWVRRFLVDYPS